MRVIVYGDYTVDRYTRVRTTRNCPEAPSAPVYDVQEKILQSPGCAGNTLLNIFALEQLFPESFDIAVLGAGGDLAGRMLDDEAYLSGRITEGNWQMLLRKSADIVKERLVLDDRVIARIDSSRSFEGLPPVVYDEVDPASDLLIVSDYCFGGVDPDQVRTLIRCADVSIVDTKRTDLSIFEGATFFKFNREEFARHPRDSIPPLSGVVVSCGEEGCRVIPPPHDMRSHDHPDDVVDPFPVTESVDVTGCGDTFTAAFGLYLAHGCGPYAAAYRANYLASRVVRRLGASVPTAEEIEEGKRMGVL